MSFDKAKFMKQGFEQRTAKVEVPNLSFFFEDSPVITVRGLTANENSIAKQSATQQKDLITIVKSLSNSEEKISNLKEILGLDGGTTIDISNRLNQLAMGSVDPNLEIDVCVKIAEYFPFDFYNLTNKIIELTGLGADVKK